MWLLEGILSEAVQWVLGKLPKPVRIGCYTLMVLFLIAIAVLAITDN